MQEKRRYAVAGASACRIRILLQETKAQLQWNLSYSEYRELIFLNTL